MTVRRKGREYALQMIFQWSMSPREPRGLERSFWRGVSAADPVRQFANRLFEGAVAHTPETDALLGQTVENWRLERVAAIDLSILRLAVYELRSTDAPYGVVIDEALELSKTFSSDESAAFINGVLNTIVQAGKAKG